MQADGTLSSKIVSAPERAGFCNPVKYTAVRFGQFWKTTPSRLVRPLGITTSVSCVQFENAPAEIDVTSGGTTNIVTSSRITCTNFKPSRTQVPFATKAIGRFQTVFGRVPSSFSQPHLTGT